MLTWLFKLIRWFDEYKVRRDDMYISEQHLDEILREKGKQ